MKKVSLALWCGLVIGLAAGSSPADILMDDDTQVAANELDTVLHLSKFDTSLGTLTGVWVQIELRLKNAEIEMDNDASQAQNGTGWVVNTASSLTSGVSLVKTDYDSIDKGDLAINQSQVFLLSATSGDPTGQFDATGAGDYAAWQPGVLTSGDSGNILESAWDDYKGTGVFTITVNTTYLTSATFAGSNGFFQGNTPDGELYGKVIYTYVVPEPATLSLLALGGIALLLRRRRR
ncbi:MAG TPA: choice-of-anchor E domain-containing protein [Phycisphaerae bacterium]|nr:choice-of-anchor E domain-containing protein [Phycisphaerae bacterium]